LPGNATSSEGGARYGETSIHFQMLRLTKNIVVILLSFAFLQQLAMIVKKFHEGYRGTSVTYELAAVQHSPHVMLCGGVKFDHALNFSGFIAWATHKLHANDRK